MLIAKIIRPAFEIDLPPGLYSLTWIDTKTGGKNITDLKDHQGGWAMINSIGFSEDIALKLVKDKVKE